MILADIRHYLRQRQQATLTDIALHFDADPEAVRGMLEHCMRKGKVSRYAAHAACGGSCRKCDPATTEIYLWVEAGDRPGTQRIGIPTPCDRG